MKPTAIIFICLCLVECSKEPTSTQQTAVDIKGRWRGSTDSLKLDFTIFTDRVGGGNITGTGYINDTVYIDPVYGSYNYPNVCLILLNPVGPCNFNGRVGDKTIAGTFSYGIHQNKSITLNFVPTLISGNRWPPIPRSS